VVQERGITRYGTVWIRVWWLTPQERQPVMCIHLDDAEMKLLVKSLRIASRERNPGGLDDKEAYDEPEE
jgi:hypothetical protein